MTPAELSVIFFLQLAVLLVACRITGWAVRRFLGQPHVMGEMIAGVLLGPSLFGLLAPETQAMLFPAETRPILYVAAQLGIGLYMFTVGLQFRRDHFRTHGRSAVAVSLAGIAAPFAIAVAMTPWLYDVPGLFTPRMSELQAILFMGACISITAFPMLARIIDERGINKSPLGAMSLSAGAISDAAAWSVLAIVLASFGGGPMVAVKAILGGVGFALVMILLGPRLLRPLGRWAERDGEVGQPLLATCLVLFALAAFFTDWVGIHSVFGGFILGAVMPRGLLAAGLRKALEPITMVLLLPIFFAFSGLNTQLNLAGNAQIAMVGFAILAASILAKGGACWAAARLSGQDNATALAIGALMNARGMMELLIINIGLQRGLIGPALFSILVLMTIVTTFMATPVFEAVYGRAARARGELGVLSEDEETAGREALNRGG